MHFDRVGPVRDVMRFHLVYSGPLSASGNKSKMDEAAKIRASISPQLSNLRDKHHALQVLLREGAKLGPPSANAIIRSIGPGGVPTPPRQLSARPGSGWIDLLSFVAVSGTDFFPLVRNSLDLNCELDILFLRQQDPGGLVSQGGDIDNRIKTLLDALRMPSPTEQHRFPNEGDPVYCLMESDTLVSRLNVDTDRLLFPESEKANEVHLVIEVTVNVLSVGPHNTCLL